MRADDRRALGLRGSERIEPVVVRGETLCVRDDALAGRDDALFSSAESVVELESCLRTLPAALREHVQSGNPFPDDVASSRDGVVALPAIVVEQDPALASLYAIVSS